MTIYSSLTSLVRGAGPNIVIGFEIVKFFFPSRDLINDSEYIFDDCSRIKFER